MSAKVVTITDKSCRNPVIYLKDIMKVAVIRLSWVENKIPAVQVTNNSYGYITNDD